jgi:hypothetical protein
LNDEIDAFASSFVEALAAIQHAHARQFIAPENMQRLRHGRTWTEPAGETFKEGELKAHSAEMITPFEDIVRNDLSLIHRSILAITSSLQSQFQASLYSTISDACDRSGNVVHAEKGVSFAEMFKAMLEKIEFVADKEGRVSMPHLHLDSMAVDKIREELARQPPEFEVEIERIKAEKVSAAVRNEAERKKRFAYYGK